MESESFGPIVEIISLESNVLNEFICFCIEIRGVIFELIDSRQDYGCIDVSYRESFCNHLIDKDIIERLLVYTLKKRSVDEAVLLVGLYFKRWNQEMGQSSLEVEPKILLMVWIYSNVYRNISQSKESLTCLEMNILKL
jgi:hypothetical protein